MTNHKDISVTDLTNEEMMKFRKILNLPPKIASGASITLFHMLTPFDASAAADF